MRVVSWNMQKGKKDNGKQRTWDYLLKTLKPEPDVALLQDSSPNKDATIRATEPIEVDVKKKDGVTKNIKNTIYSKSGGLCPFPIYSDSVGLKEAKLPYDGGMGFNVASKKCDGFGHVYFISIYGNLAFWDEKYIKIEMNWFDIHIIGVLTVYVRTLREIYGARHIIIAGDFNIDPRDDTHPDYGREGYNRWSGHFADICKLGFKDCLEGKHIPTHLNNKKNRNNEKIWRCIDHFFATKELFSRLKHVEVKEEVVKKEISDHNPIVADFE